MATQYSVTPGAGVQGVSIDDNRRVFDFGGRIAELAPQQSPFFVYLSKVGKKTTPDPVFKFLEQRHQWQRRQFKINNASGVISGAVSASPALSDLNLSAAAIDCDVDNYGRTVSASAAKFLLIGQIVAIEGMFSNETSSWTYDIPVTAYYKITAVASNSSTVDLTCIKLINKPTKASDAATVTPSVTGATTLVQNNKLKLVDNARGTVIGSAFAEATGKPTSWKDELFDREGYCQIFKTGIDLFSGTSLSTEYRGVSDEYKRVWREKLMEHKMDIEQAMLFGVGASDESGSGPARRSWGIIPYTELNGKVYSLDYSANGYDQFLDVMEDFFHPESGNSGNKLVLASRKILSWMNKLAAGNFLGNTVPATQYTLDIASIPGNFGHQVTRVNTIFGDLHFVQEPLLRGAYEDYAVMVDMNNVAYRTLSGNGVSRDTHIMTNIQANDMDGRQDMILTEAGLEIQLPETHGIMAFQA